MGCDIPCMFIHSLRACFLRLQLSRLLSLCSQPPSVRSSQEAPASGSQQTRE